MAVLQGSASFAGAGALRADSSIAFAHTVDYVPIANGPSAVVETQAQYLIDLGASGALANGMQMGILYPTTINKIVRQSSMMSAALARFVAYTNNTNLLDDGNLPALTGALTAAIASAASTPTPPAPGTLAGLAIAETFQNTVARIKWNQLTYATAYTVVVKHTAGGATLRTATTTDLLYEYSYEDAADDGGPFPDLTFVVNGFNTTGAGGTATLVTTPKPVPSAPSITSTALPGGVNIFAAVPTDTTIFGLKVWGSTTNGFTPGGGNLLYQGFDINKDFLGLTGGTAYYFQAAFYDKWGQEGTHTSQFSVTPSVISGTGGIAVVSTLGAVPAQGTVEFLTTDNKIYRSTGSAWIKSVDGADLVAASVAAAAIGVSTLASITPALGAITSGTWVMGSSDFMRGGMTNYATGNGFWAGFHSANYQWSVGNSASNQPLMTWDGTTLSVLNPSINLGAIGSIFGGMTGYNTGGTGLWMGFSGSAWAFSLGNPSGAGLTWNGTALTLNQPQLNAAQGSFNGSLSNATGTFSGTVNGTATVPMNAIVPSAVTTFGFSELNTQQQLGPGFLTVATVTGFPQFLSGGGLIIDACMDIANPGGGGGNHQIQVLRTIAGVTSTVWQSYAYQLSTGQSAAFSKRWVDNIGAGNSATYQLQVKATNASDVCKNISLTVTELKR